MMLTGLIPFVYYKLRITAENGVSSQDNDINARTVTISIMTEEGGSIIVRPLSVSVQTSVLVCMSVYMCAVRGTRMWVVYMHTRVVCTCVYVCVCVYLCVCACMCVYSVDTL